MDNKVVEEKTKPQLIVETPRAGKWNHLFILATGNKSESDSDIAKIVAAARRKEQGDDYISVSVKREQFLSGRTGTEILVLTGIDVKKLSESKRQKIVEQLELRLNNDLDKLITETIDWDKDGEDILLKRPELAEWEKEFSKFKLDTLIIETNKPKSKNKPTKLKMGLVAGGVVVLLVLGVWQLELSPESDSTTVIIENQTKSENSPRDKPKPTNCIKPVLKNIEKLLTYPPISCENKNLTLTNFNDFIKDSCQITLYEYYWIHFINNENTGHKVDKKKVDKLKQEFENCKKEDKNAK